MPYGTPWRAYTALCGAKQCLSLPQPPSLCAPDHLAAFIPFNVPLWYPVPIPFGNTRAPYAANTQEHENEVAEVVIVCEPEQASLMMGGLHPRGSLYERPVNIDTAKQQHSEFRNVSWGWGVGMCIIGRGVYNRCGRPG